jgi:hypothetical protein
VARLLAEAADSGKMRATSGSDKARAAKAARTAIYRESVVSEIAVARQPANAPESAILAASRG